MDDLRTSFELPRRFPELDGLWGQISYRVSGGVGTPLVAEMLAERDRPSFDLATWMIWLPFAGLADLGMSETERYTRVSAPLFSTLRERLQEERNPERRKQLMRMILQNVHEHVHFVDAMLLPSARVLLDLRTLLLRQALVTGAQLVRAKRTLCRPFCEGMANLGKKPKQVAVDSPERQLALVYMAFLSAAKSIRANVALPWTNDRPAVTPALGVLRMSYFDGSTSELPVILNGVTAVEEGKSRKMAAATPIGADSLLEARATLLGEELVRCYAPELTEFSRAETRGKAPVYNACATLLNRISRSTTGTQINRDQAFQLAALALTARPRAFWEVGGGNAVGEGWPGHKFLEVIARYVRLAPWANDIPLTEKYDTRMERESDRSFFEDSRKLTLIARDDRGSVTEARLGEGERDPAYPTFDPDALGPGPNRLLQYYRHLVLTQRDSLEAAGLWYPWLTTYQWIEIASSFHMAPLVQARADGVACLLLYPETYGAVDLIFDLASYVCLDEAIKQGALHNAVKCPLLMERYKKAFVEYRAGDPHCTACRDTDSPREFFLGSKPTGHCLFVNILRSLSFVK